MASKAEIKDRAGRIGINQLVTYLGLVPIFWFVIQPILVNALADDIKKTVATEVAPINNAFVALLQRDINEVKIEIASLEFRQNQEGDWTEQDSKYLAGKEIELAALEEAKAALQVNTS